MSRLLRWFAGFALLFLLLREPDAALGPDPLADPLIPLDTQQSRSLEPDEFPFAGRTGNLDVMASGLAHHSRETAREMIGILVKLGNWFVN